MAWYDFLTGNSDQGIVDQATAAMNPVTEEEQAKLDAASKGWDQSTYDQQTAAQDAMSEANTSGAYQNLPTSNLPDFMNTAAKAAGAGGAADNSPGIMDKLSSAFGSAGKALASPFSGLSGTQNTALAAAGIGTLGSVLGYKAGQAGQNAAMANQQAALDAANRLNVLKDPTVAAVQDNAQQLAARSTALQGLQDRATMGLTPQDQADLNNIRNQSNQQFQANQNQISENMQRRGVGNSGMGLAQSLGAAQAQQQNASQQGDQLAAMSFNAKQNALNNLASNTNQMLTSDFNRNVTKAASTDAVSQFNTNQQNARDAAVRDQQNKLAQANIAKGTAQAQGIGNISQGIATGIGNVANSTSGNVQVPGQNNKNKQQS